MRRSIVLLALAGVLSLLPDSAAAQENPFADCGVEQNTVSSGGQSSTPIEGGRFVNLTGPVIVTCREFMLLADAVDYDTISEEVRARGNVALIQADLTLYAEHAIMNKRTKLGTFYQASGWGRIGDAPTTRSSFGTAESDFRFYGTEIAKIGPERYAIKGGGFTSCVQATPRWEMATSDTTITLDKHALMKNVILRVKDVPLLYVPVMYYPINKEDRATGFLMPQYGATTYQGTSLSNAFFLVLGRSQDATFYHNWYQETGQGFGADYRYVASESGRGNVSFNMFNTRPEYAEDGQTIMRPGEREYQINGDTSQSLPHGFGFNGYVRYFSSAATQQLYQDIIDASRRDREFAANLSGRVNRYRIDAKFQQVDRFSGTSQATRFGSRPSALVTMTDMPIGRSRVYVGARGQVEYLLRQDDIEDPATDRSLWRFDGGPALRAPLSTLPFLTATGTAAWRITRWLESKDPLTGQQVGTPLTRQVFDLGANLVGPVLARVFLTPNNGYADGFKHLIEPGISVRRTISPFTAYGLTVSHDHVDTAVPNVTSVTYRVTNRVLARRVRPALVPGTPAPPGIAREILSVDISQTYYSDRLAAEADPLNQIFESNVPQTSNFQPLTIAVRAQPADLASADFKMWIDASRRAIRNMSASSTVRIERMDLTAEWTKTFTIPGLRGFEGEGAHALSARTAIRTRDNRISGSYSFSLDVGDGSFLQQRILGSYNTQCCGVSFDWQSSKMPFLHSGIDRRFGISFSLAGIGSFSNPLGSFGGQ
jgi:hypothetical protein